MMKTSTILALILILVVSCHSIDKRVSVKEKVDAQKVSATKTADESQTIFNFYKEYFSESNSKNGQKILAEYTTKQFSDKKLDVFAPLLKMMVFHS